MRLSRSAGDDPPEIHWPPAEIPDVELPEAFDWRDHGAVTDVKNQVIECFTLNWVGVGGFNESNRGKIQGNVRFVLGFQRDRQRGGTASNHQRFHSCVIF